MSSQLEETTYQNNVATEIFDEEDPSQGVDYNAADLLTPTIVPGEVNATEDEHEAQVTTITFDSAVIEKQVRIIDREYFVTKKQRTNNLRKTEIGQEWEILKRDVLKIIDSDLNLQFILNAQNKGIKFLSNNTRQNAQSIKDIGASYAQDLSNENMTKMNYVMYTWFTDNPLFVKNLENNVMRELNLEYDKKTEDMGCIARLVNMRKNDKVIILYYSISIVYRHLLSNISFIIKIKNIAGRGKATHQVRISKQRSSVEKKGDAGRRRPKVTRSFKLNDKWFNIDGSDYNDLGKLRSETHPNPTKSEDDMKKEMESMASELSHYKERVNEMQSSDKKVLFILQVYLVSIFLYDMNIFIYGIIFRDMGDLEDIW